MSKCDNCTPAKLHKDTPVLINKMEFHKAGEGNIHTHYFDHVGLAAWGGPFEVEKSDGSRETVTEILIRANDRHKIIAKGPGLWLCIFSNHGAGSADLRG